MAYFRSSIILIFTCLILGLPVSAQDSIDTEKLDRFFTQLSENNRFMGSVAILSGNDIVFESAYGVISADGKPATTETVYRVGSITKSFTAAMIMKLAERDSLSLDTTLENYFPNLPNADEITIEILLRHQSGLVNFTNMPDYVSYFEDETFREQMLNRFQEAGTSFEPGESTEYSNTGYVLLGYIVEDETDLSYTDALQQMITGPLDLSSTYYATGIDPDLNEADSFTFQENDWVPASRTNMFIPGGAGAIASTAEETARFFRNLLKGDMLTEESLREMTAFEGSYGLGLSRFPFGDRTFVGHNGGIDGFRSNAAHYADGDLTMAILSNGLNYNFNDILIGTLSIVFGQDYEIPNVEERAALTLPKDKLEKYTGSYSSSNFPLDIELFLDGDNLMAQATGQGAFPLTIYSETTMAFEQAGIDMEFSDFSDGRYHAFRFTQAGQQFDFMLQEDLE